MIESAETLALTISKLNNERALNAFKGAKILNFTIQPVKNRKRMLELTITTNVKPVAMLDVNFSFEKQKAEVVESTNCFTVLSPLKLRVKY
jgi:phage regulator Rha-like protein